MEYEHRQHGWTGVMMTLFFVVIAAISLPSIAEEQPSAMWWLIAGYIAVIVLVVWFSWLTVTVKDGHIAAAFGLGRPHRVMELSDVVSATQVRNHWFDGWGVRKVSNGWMYNVWGLDAVELELTSGKVFRIGTDEPELLHAAISLHPKL